MKNKAHSKTVAQAKEYPERTDSDEMARAARKMLNAMTEDEVEEHFNAAMARVYGGRSAQQTTVS